MHSPIFSLEIFPPRRTASVETIYDTLDGLEGLSPDFISITYGTGKHSDNTQTARIASTVYHEYGIKTVAHLTSLFVNHDDVDQMIELLRKAGTTSILVLRGDEVDGRAPTGVFPHASDLANYIHTQYPEFELFGACYPEGHPQAPSLSVDIDNLQRKIDAGVQHLISQLFYSVDDYINFVNTARQKGITVPIEAGIMPVRSVKSTLNMAEKCGASVPKKLTRILNKWGDNPKALRQAGIAYASEQIAELVSQNADGIHLYSMNHPAMVRKIWANTSELFTPAVNSISSAEPKANK